MNVAICEYGAGNVRSVELAFARLGARARRRRRAAPISPCCPASARRAPRWPGCASAGTTSRCASAFDGGTAGARHLPRPAARARVDGRGRRRRGARPRARAAPSRLRDGPRAAHGLGRGRRPRARSTSRTRTPRETPRATAWSEGVVAEARAGSFVGCQFHPEKSGAAGARSQRARGGAIPLPRLIPCLDVAAGRVVKGVRFQGLRDVGDPGRARRRVLRRGRRRARLPRRARRRSSDRATLVELVRRVAERLAIPFTVGGGVRSVADAEELLAAGADKVAVNSAALERPELITELAERLGSQAVVVAIDAEGGRVRSRAGTTETARDAVDWAREARGARRGRDPAHLDRRRRDARGLRPRADRRRRRRGRRAGDRVGRRRQRAARRRRARGRAGGAARVDPARGPGAARVAARRAARARGARCAMQLKAGDRAGRGRRPRADARAGWTTRPSA